MHPSSINLNVNSVVIRRLLGCVVACLAGCSCSLFAVAQDRPYDLYEAAERGPLSPDLLPMIGPARVQTGPSKGDIQAMSAEPVYLPLAPSEAGAGPPTSMSEFEPLFVDRTAPDTSAPCRTHVSGACRCPGWIAGVQYVNWGLRRRGLDYAVLEDGTAITLGSGRVQNLAFSRDAGVRASLGYQFDAWWQLEFGYTWFDSEALDSAVRPPGAGQLFSTRSHPVNSQEADAASALGSFDLRVFDLEAARWLQLDHVSALKVFAGLRFADIEENLVFDYDGRDFTNGRISNPVNINGFGIRSGLEGRWDMFRRLSLFGRAAVSVMFANFTTRLTETDFGGAVLIADELDEYEQALPVLEAQLGGTYYFDQAEVACGYELSNWFNLGERATFHDAANEGIYGPFSTDILLEGFVLRITLRR